MLVDDLAIKREYRSTYRVIYTTTSTINTDHIQPVQSSYAFARHFYARTSALHSLIPKTAPIMNGIIHFIKMYKNKLSTCVCV